MMTKSLALAFAALALSASAALAAPAPASAAGDIVAQKSVQTAQATGTPYAPSSSNSLVAPTFNYGTSAPVTSNILPGALFPPRNGIALQNGVFSLLNETGGGR